MIAIRTDYGIKMLKFSHNIKLRQKMQIFLQHLGEAGYVFFIAEFNESGKYYSDILAV